jgi:DNA-binding MarR family transcriptional regulator
MKSRAAKLGPSSSLPSLPCACSTLRRAARAVTQLYDQELRSTGLRATQFTLLMALSHRNDITQGELSNLLALDSTTLTRMLRLLEKDGWIRSIPGDDRRERHLSLTAAGKRKLQEARRHWQKAQARLHASLGGGEWERLQATLDSITAAAREA